MCEARHNAGRFGTTWRQGLGLLLWLGLAILCRPAIGDAEHFPVPTALRADVDFWKRIYSEVESNAGLLHDERRLGIVYGRLDFGAVDRREDRQRLVDARKAEIRKALQEILAAAGPLSESAARINALWIEATGDGPDTAAARRIRFQLGQADPFRDGLVRASRFTAHILETLRAHGLPEGLVVLPQVESSYNHLARSRVGAAGMWQFTRTTGRRYLRIDRVVDERLDPYRSTQAAARLLKQNLKLTGNWPLAITAYNHGVAGIRRAVRQLDSDRIEDLVRRYKSRRFGFASRNFYVAFAAALEVWKDADRHFGELPVRNWPDTHSIVLPAFVAASDVARALDVTIDTLQDLNPALRRSVWNDRKRIPKDYRLRVPAPIDATASTDLLSGIPAERWFASQHIDRVHRVRNGQTLSGIAAEYGISPRELARYNAISDRDFIRRGQTLHLPPRRVEAPAPPDGRYVVRAGDSLSTIARRFRMDTDELAELNGLRDANRLFPGEVLIVSEKANSDVPAPDVSTEALSGPQTPQPDVSDGVVSLDDPIDYAIGADGSIEIQVLETLGHYSLWSGLGIRQISRLNGLSGKPVLVVGRRLKLGLAGESASRFERLRADFHRRVQAAFFRRYQVADTLEHEVRNGESLWLLAKRHYGLPVWLLRQFNPDLNPDRVRAGTRVVIPRLVRRPTDPVDPNRSAS